MKLKMLTVLMLSLTQAIFAADGPKSVRGTVESIDLQASLVEVKGPDGILYRVDVTEIAEVDGVKPRGPVVRSITKGSELIVHGTATGTKVTARELYHVGTGGLEVSTATVRAVGAGGKFVVVKTAQGGEATFHITSKALQETAKGTAKGTRVVIYSSATAGKKVAHFFESAV